MKDETTTLYVYAWKNNSVRASFCGLRCSVVARGKMNSCLLKFEDGRYLVTSRNAIRKNMNDETIRYADKKRP